MVTQATDLANRTNEDDAAYCLERVVVHGVWTQGSELGVGKDTSCILCLGLRPLRVCVRNRWNQLALPVTYEDSLDDSIAIPLCSIHLPSTESVP
jgi:hypothetical protein